MGRRENFRTSEKTERRHLTRRRFLAASTLPLVEPLLMEDVVSESAFPMKTMLAGIEKESGGRLGVALLDSENGQISGYRLQEPFPMCSTFKVLAVAAVLARVDEGLEQLGRSIPITNADILEYAPVTSRHIGPVGMTLAQLCEAAITLSDNTAANLLLKVLGGPRMVTAFARSLGDEQTRLDRNEPTLNEAAPRDLRDTSTPAAMVRDLNSLVLQERLSVSSRQLLREWMKACKTGSNKIRSAVPKSTVVGDKTGSGGHNTSNDVAVLWPVDSPPLVLAIYLTEVNPSSIDQQAGFIAAAARACLSGKMNRAACECMPGQQPFQLSRLVYEDYSTHE